MQECYQINYEIEKIKIGGIIHEKNNRNNKDNINRDICRCKNVIRLIIKQKKIKIGGLDMKKTIEIVKIILIGIFIDARMLLD